MLFSLDGQVCGAKRSVNAQNDGAGGITVHTSSGPHRVRNTNEAIRLARADMGEFLLPAQRGGRPWGLRVQVGDAAAVYGEWPGFPGAPGGRPDTSLVTRIRSRWHDSGPISALENAIQVIRAYLPPSRAAAA